MQEQEAKYLSRSRNARVAAAASSAFDDFMDLGDGEGATDEQVSEEKSAKKKAQKKKSTDEDSDDSDDDSEEDEEKVTHFDAARIQLASEFGSMSKKDQQAYIARECPELVGLLSDFEAYTEELGILDEVSDLSQNAATKSEFEKLLHPQKQELVRARKLVVGNYVANLSFWLRFAASKNYTKDHPIFNTLLETKALVERLNKSYPREQLREELEMLLDGLADEEEEDDDDMGMSMGMDGEEEEDDMDDDEDDPVEISDAENFEFDMDKLEEADLPDKSAKMSKSKSPEAAPSEASASSSSKKSGGLSLKDKVLRMRERSAAEAADAAAEASERRDSAAANTFLEMMQARKLYGDGGKKQKAGFKEDNDPTLGPRAQPADAKANMHNLIMAGQKVIDGKEGESANAVDANVEFKKRDRKETNYSMAGDDDADGEVNESLFGKDGGVMDEDAQLAEAEMAELEKTLEDPSVPGILKEALMKQFQKKQSVRQQRKAERAQKEVARREGLIKTTKRATTCDEYVLRGDIEVDGKGKNTTREISRKIMKNRGLTRTRKKIDRNSRVKLRMKYDKALKKRKSTVQTMREESARGYGGEMTGIKGNVVKSHKLK